MPTARLSSKSQLVIPKPIREHLEVGPGDRLDFEITDAGDVLVRSLTCAVTELRGLLADPDRRPVSVDQMRQTVRERGSQKGKP